MKCLLYSAAYGWLTDKAPYFKMCDYIKHGIVDGYTSEYIEGDVNFIFEKLKEIADTVQNHTFIVYFRDDGDIEAKIYDDYIE